VGYRDPVLGYVELRAQSNGGAVHASLGAQSNSAGATLSADLPALAAWMEASHTPVATISVVAIHGGEAGSTAMPGAHSGSGGLGGNPLAGSGMGFGQDLGQHSGQSSNPDARGSSGNGWGDEMAEGLGSAGKPPTASATAPGDRGSPAGWELGSAGESGFASGSSISVLA